MGQVKFKRRYVIACPVKWGDIIYSFPHFNGWTVEVWENYVITSNMLGLMLIHVSKRGPRPNGNWHGMESVQKKLMLYICLQRLESTRLPLDNLIFNDQNLDSAVKSRFCLQPSSTTDKSTVLSDNWILHAIKRLQQITIINPDYLILLTLT